MMSASSLFSVLALVAGFVAIWKYLRAPSRGLPYPPGPKGLPLIGNLLDLPTQWQWLEFNKLAAKYGDVIHMKVFGQSIIILNSVEAAIDLLERRSANSSSRPRMIMLKELMGFDWLMSTMQYGDTWRALRRTFHTSFHQGAVDQWEHVQVREVQEFLKRLLSNPNDFRALIKHFFGAAIMDIVYNIPIEDTDEYVATAETVMDYLNQAGTPGAFLVDSLPLLKYVPSWAPGAGFQRTAAECRRTLAILINKPFELVKDALLRGDAGQCVAALMIQNSTSDDDSLLRHTAATAYLGGAETTGSSITSFFLAMAMYPDVQKKAQAELDAVTGADRLPTFSDRANLPYVNAIISEVLRWQPVTPLAFPHTTSSDDVYRGYIIPAGTTFVANAWAILHDPQEYPDPEVFNPERFVVSSSDGTLAPNTKVRDPRIACYGFGRRKCPGRHLAEQSLFVVITSVLSVYWISPSVSDDGMPIPLEARLQPGIVCHPIPFKCSIQPRSASAEALICRPKVSPDV